MTLEIRTEKPEDYRQVEHITREAFWNLFVPGCDEHYLAHILRTHKDFIPELSFVALVDGIIAGSIMYTRSRLVAPDGSALSALTFGPISVIPALQGRGIGSALIRHSFTACEQRGDSIVVIEGHPHNYCRHGFVGSKSCGISNSDGRFPYSLLVRELKPGVLSGGTWTYHPSDVFTSITPEAVEEFDRHFPHKEKAFRYTQVEFDIASRSFVE